MRLHLLFALILLAATANAATISGTLYEWYSLEPLEECIIEINTTPEQTIVSENGTYSFTAPEGTYTIRAMYFENNLLKYETTEELVITEDGNFTLDLLMFPNIGEPEFLFNDLNTTNITEEDFGEGQESNSGGMIIGGVILVVIALAVVVLGARKITTKMTGLETQRISLEEKYSKIPREMETAMKEETASNAEEKNGTGKPLDDALEEVLELLRRYGGRMTQKELRDKVTHGEAKVSLLVAELEEMGKVKKIKQGRGNIIVLKE